MSRVSETYERMKGEWSGLQRQWTLTCQDWRDTVQQRFEKEFWSEWEERVPTALKALAELEYVLRQAVLNTR